MELVWIRHCMYFTQDTLNTIKSLQASGLSFSTHNVYLTTTQTLSQSHKVYLKPQSQYYTDMYII